MMPEPIEYYDPNLAIWPDLIAGKVPLAPVRVGVDRRTGKVLVGWPHVQQSLGVIFSTRYHERVLRRYVGSFVPHLLGESALPRIITRFFWAIASAIDLWEPCYSIQRVLVGPEVSPETVRLGNFTFQNDGVYRPRGHLGDMTPERRRVGGFIGRGEGVWDATA